MKILISFLVFLLFAITVQASDSLQVSFVKKKLLTGDTLEFTCVVPQFAQIGLTSATLNVWIEDVEKHKRWKYRYPMINGEVSASLAVTDKIPDGKYAVNFLVQRGFFRISGKIRDHFKSDTLINYVMIQKKQKNSYFDNARVATDGSFRLKSTLFADSAFFVFMPAKKTKNNYFFIHAETPLDSVFTPVLQETDFITVGDDKMLGAVKTDTASYSFKVDEISQPGLLPGVTVTARAKKKVELYEEEYVSGLFKGGDPIIFDGLESEDIARSLSVLQFLQSRVAGLSVIKDANGEDVPVWRKEAVEIYIDEFRLSNGEQIYIIPSEVAMIKVYRPPAMLSPLNGSGGAIAIYTKKGNFAGDSKTRYSFVVKGYTNIESRWE